MTTTQRTYLPAAGRDWALPFYDPLVRLLGAERIQKAFLHQASLQPGHRVLDIGCGTGNLVVLIKRLHPDVDVIGLDPDPKALARAKRKTERAGVTARLDQGFSDSLPYPDLSFDRVFSTFMFHHLPRSQREPTLREVRRVLKPGGSFQLLDFAGPHSASGLLARVLHSSPRLKDNTDDRILTLMRQAGFADPKNLGLQTMLFWQVASYQASAPPPTATA